MSIFGGMDWYYAFVNLCGVLFAYRTCPRGLGAIRVLYPARGLLRLASSHAAIWYKIQVLTALRS